MTDLCPRYGPDLTCSPLSCGSPQSSAHAQVTAECTSFRCQARVSCQPGYTVREGGAATRICQADGTWTQVRATDGHQTSDVVRFQANLDCIPVRCNLPENPLNGKALFSSTDFGAVVNYEEHFQ